MTKQQPVFDEETKQRIAELTSDLQRVQADFVNYRARMEEDRQRTMEAAKGATVMKLLPVIDDIERAIGHIPAELAENTWAKGIAGLGKKLEKSLDELGVKRIAAVGQAFDPNLHEAISAEGEGDDEVVNEELRAGYSMNGAVVRPAMVTVNRRPATTEPTVAPDQQIHEQIDTETPEARGPED